MQEAIVWICSLSILPFKVRVCVNIAVKQKNEHTQKPMACLIQFCAALLYIKTEYIIEIWTAIDLSHLVKFLTL